MKNETEKWFLVRNVVSWKRCEATLCLPTGNVLLYDVLTSNMKLEILRGKFLWIFEVFKGKVWGEKLTSLTYLTTPEKITEKGNVTLWTAGYQQLQKHLSINAGSSRNREGWKLS